MVMAAKLTRLTHKIAIQLHLMTESCTVSRSRRPGYKINGLDMRLGWRNEGCIRSFGAETSRKHPLGISTRR